MVHEITYDVDDNFEGEGYRMHRLVYLEGTEPRGELLISDAPDGSHVIWGVEIDPAYRRRGIATRLLQEAREHLGEVQHSERQTPEGHAWAHAVGGRRYGRREDWVTE